MGDADTFKILVATDCHLGYMEKDEIRRHDSFKTFDEICGIAAERQVDFILLGGDLFHENRPSSATLVQAIEILRRHCLNDLPVQFQVVSDQTVNFPNRFGHVNYEDPHYNVGLPVFTIHGNHDDPAGVDNISALDILSASNLVNYFGKVDLGGSGVGKISLHPILLRKGLTKIALYGLGNIRDERLSRIFQTPQAVQWIRPAEREDCPSSEWFNMFVLHQNRVKANPKSAINEHFLARFLDFVVWGHEHECIVDPQEVPGMGFHVSQPGSSVATSLTDGEAQPKHVLMLEIKGNKYRPTKIPLKTVRPFEFADVILKDVDTIQHNDQKSILSYLETKVESLISTAAAIAPSTLPLIRVRVDYTQCTTINPQKFGQKFVGKVANPHDLLTFTKTAKKKQKIQVDDEEKELLQPEELNQQTIEALVAESNPKMEILPLSVLSLALHDYVNKDDKQAFHSCVQYTLEETQKKLLEDEDAKIEPESDITNLVSVHIQAPAADSSRPWAQSQAQTQGASTSNTGKRVSLDDDVDDFGDNLTTVTPTPARGRAAQKSQSTPGDGASQGRGRGRGRARGRGRGGAAASLKQTTLDVVSLGTRRSSRSTVVVDESEEEGVAQTPSEELEEPESEEEMATTKGGRKRSAPASKRGAGRGGQSSSKRTRKTSRDDDDDVDDEDESVPITSTRTSRRRK